MNVQRTLKVGKAEYCYWSLPKATEEFAGIARLPRSLKVLVENVLRLHNASSAAVNAVVSSSQPGRLAQEPRSIEFRPARILSQDLAGVPLVVDLASLRDAIVARGGDPTRVNPVVPIDLIVDHSIVVDHFGDSNSLRRNETLELERNKERFEFLKWAERSFKNFRVVPPGKGICHQVNLEFLSKVVWTSIDDNGRLNAYPDTVIGTDSHTTMVNALGVLGWGVGGTEAESVMLGESMSMNVPSVLGVRIEGSLREGTTATDVVLTMTEALRRRGVVGKFVEFFGSGLENLSVPDMATIANMAPDYGATCGYFPVGPWTITYLKATGREEAQIALVEAYARAQELWVGTDVADPEFPDVMDFDLSSVEPCIAGPRRPQDRLNLADVAESFSGFLRKANHPSDPKPVAADGTQFEICDGDIVIAAITSCTNTSNPYSMISAGLVAKKARQLGLRKRMHVKASLAPGSQVVSDYLIQAGLQEHLDALGFTVVGYGCTTCIGNAGPLDAAIANRIRRENIAPTAVLSGNRNFEGRISPDIRFAYLASPPLVVAFAIAGSIKVNLITDPLGIGADGRKVFLRDIWPTASEIATVASSVMSPEMFKSRYRKVWKGSQGWEELTTPQGATFQWSPSSSYISSPPYFTDESECLTGLSDIRNGRILMIVGDSFTTDHISPAGAIAKTSPAGAYLASLGISEENFSTYGARRGNHEVMVRGAFSNSRIHNEMLAGVTGGRTLHVPTAEVVSIFDAAEEYRKAGTPLVIVGGKEYGTGSSRDWASKATGLLGVKAVIAEGFERIHRANLVAMAVLPLRLKSASGRADLALQGTELVDILGLEFLAPQAELQVVFTGSNGQARKVNVVACIDTEVEMKYLRSGGLLRYVLGKLIA